MDILRLKHLFEAHREDLRHLKRQQTTLVVVGIPIMALFLMLEFFTIRHSGLNRMNEVMWIMDFIDSSLLLGWAWWSMVFMRTIDKFTRESTMLMLDALDEMNLHIQNQR